MIKALTAALLLTMALPLTPADRTADDTPAEAGHDWSLDAAERQLELWRHERLLTMLTASGSALDPFETDGCSGGLSSVWTQVATLAPEFARIHGTKPPWESCCVDHDRSYHDAGGVPKDALESFLARRQADQALRACVLATRSSRSGPLAESYGLEDAQIRGLYETVAELMYRAVRLGGIPCSGLPWRWGYGWPDCSGAEPATDDDAPRR